MELYRHINSQFVIDHHLQNHIFDQYAGEIRQYGGITGVIDALSLVSKTIRDIKHPETDDNKEGK